MIAGENGWRSATERAELALPPMETCRILGLDVAILTRSAAADMLEDRICRRTAVRLAFVNANLANIACDNPGLRDSLQRFMLLNDGVGLNIARRILCGQPFPDNLNGTDFTPYFLERCRTPLRVFLLGALPAVVARVAQIFEQRWPRHSLVGYHHGFFAMEENRVLEVVKRAKPDLVLVAMGNGLQEQWVERLVPEVALSAWGVGALFDFLAGGLRRAPLWLRRGNLEWVYRLSQEPRRLWQRYVLGNPTFVMRVLRERGSRRKV